MQREVGAGPIERDLTIDRFRGFLVIMMVVGDYLGGVNWIPAELKHAPDIGFTIADIVAPAFMFIMALNLGPSYRRHLVDGRSAANGYFLRRYLSLIGIGAIISAGSVLADRPSSWGVLESLGVAGLITMALIGFSTWVRAGVGLLLLVGYQWALDNWMLHNVLTSGHGGFFGSLSWSALLLLATAMADLWRRGLMPYLIGLAGVMAATVLTMFVVPVSKNRVSLSYVLLSLAISALAFLIVKLVAGARVWRAGVFVWWGQRSLAMYLLHLLALSVFGLSPAAWWYADVPGWLMGLQLAAILVGLSFVARWLAARKEKTRLS